MDFASHTFPSGNPELVVRIGWGVEPLEGNWETTPRSTSNPGSKPPIGRKLIRGFGTLGCDRDRLLSFQPASGAERSAGGQSRGYPQGGHSGDPSGGRSAGFEEVRLTLATRSPS